MCPYSGYLGLEGVPIRKGYKGYWTAGQPAAIAAGTLLRPSEALCGLPKGFRGLGFSVFRVCP